MKYIVCSIRDSALDAFGVPMFMVSRGQAIRGFTDECNRAESAIAKHPECYELFYLGTWEDGVSDFDCGASPTSMIRALDCINITQGTSHASK